MDYCCCKLFILNYLQIPRSEVSKNFMSLVMAGVFGKSL